MVEYTDLIANLVKEFAYTYQPKDIGDKEMGYTKMYYVYKDCSEGDIPTVEYKDMEESEIINNVVPMLKEYGYTYRPRFEYYERRESHGNDEMNGNSKIYLYEIYRVGELGEHVYKHKNNLSFCYSTSAFASIEGSLYTYLNAVDMFKYGKDVFVTVCDSAKFAYDTLNTWMWDTIVDYGTRFMSYKIKRVFPVDYDILFNSSKKLNIDFCNTDHEYYVNTFIGYNQIVESGKYTRGTYYEMENKLHGIVSHCCNALFKMIVEESAKLVNEDRLVSVGYNGVGKIRTADGKEVELLCDKKEYFKDYYEVVDDYFNLDCDCPEFYFIIPKDCTDLREVRYCNDAYCNKYAVTFDGVSFNK